MNAETVKLLVALALILMSGLSVARSAGLPKAERPATKAPKKREHPAVLEVSGAAPLGEAATAFVAPVTAAASGSSRPRIFTGEPHESADAAPGAARRALKLAAGMTLMAAVGAIGILALVRAMVLVVERLGN
jgi:hypothetical protein